MMETVQVVASALKAILGDNLCSLYLHGSAASGDYREGWSDIDILCLTHEEFINEQAETLLTLRQALVLSRADAAFRSFEGGILPLDAFLQSAKATVVYWGTSGERIADSYDFNAISTLEWLDNGILLEGEDIRNKVERPTQQALRDDIQHHYETIREHARVTSASVYSAGWMLDIARCLYTLRYNAISSKTAAGEWALLEGLAPEPDVLEKVLEIREEPLLYLDDAESMRWRETLGPHVQAFADVLERELAARPQSEPILTA